MNRLLRPLEDGALALTREAIEDEVGELMIPSEGEETEEEDKLLLIGLGVEGKVVLSS